MSDPDRPRPTPDPDAPPYEKRYEPLWETREEPVEHKAVELHDGLTLHQGDRYIDLNGERGPYVLTVEEVYQQVPVGWDGQPLGFDLPVLVVCSTDNPWINETAGVGEKHLRIKESHFVERVRDGQYRAHAGNRYLPEELRR